MVYTRKALGKIHAAGQHFKFLFFWGHAPSADRLIAEACLSQWWKCSPMAGDTIYPCAEQLMMAEKARVFGDRDVLGGIMETREPKAMRVHGRAMRNFDKKTRDAACYGLACGGNIAKSSQNPGLWEFLKSIRERILMGASPRDRVWGAGTGKNDPDAECPLKWKGSNLPGSTLVEARDLLPEKEEGMD